MQKETLTVMKRSTLMSFAFSLAGLLSPHPLSSQQPVTQQPAFAVATIRPSSNAVQFEHDGKTEFRGDTLRMQDVTVTTCIKLAYHVQDNQIIGPGWMGDDRFDITAKSDGPADEDAMKRMLQALLAN